MHHYQAAPRDGILNGLAISSFYAILLPRVFSSTRTVRSLLLHRRVTFHQLAFPELVSQRSSSRITLQLAASAKLPWQKLERRHGRRALPPTTGHTHIIVPRRQVFGRHVFFERDGPWAL